MLKLTHLKNLNTIDTNNQDMKVNQPNIEIQSRKIIKLKIWLSPQIQIQRILD